MGEDEEGGIGGVEESRMMRTRVQLFTLRESPPAHSEALPMRADGKWKEEAHIVKLSGQEEEWEEGVEPSWRRSLSIGGLLVAMGPF